MTPVLSCMVYARMYLCLDNEMVTLGGELRNEAEMNVEVKMGKYCNGNGHTMIPSSEVWFWERKKIVVVTDFWDISVFHIILRKF